MPIYEYECRKCGAVSEFLVRSAGTDSTLKCLSCGSEELTKKMSAPGMIKNESHASGATCCGRAERCNTPPCSSGGCCR